MLVVSKKKNLIKPTSKSVSFILNTYSNKRSKSARLYLDTYLSSFHSSGSGALTGNQLPHGSAIHGVVTARVLETGSPANEIFKPRKDPAPWRMAQEPKWASLYLY